MIDKAAAHGTVGMVMQPVLVYDGDCALCSSSVRALQRMVRRLPVVVAWQQADLDALGLNEAECSEAVQWVSADGNRQSGASAIAATFRYAGRGWVMVGVMLDAPGLRHVAARLYGWVARNRHRLPGGTPACSTDERKHPTHGA